MRPLKPSSAGRRGGVAQNSFSAAATSFFAVAVAAVFLLLSPAGARAESGDERSEVVQQIERASNESLLWGPYKPNLYFGVRPRIPKSLAAGLLWSRVEDYRTVQDSAFSPFSYFPLPQSAIIEPGKATTVVQEG